MSEKMEWAEKRPGELARDPLTRWAVATLADSFVIVRLEYLAGEGDVETERTEAVQLILHPQTATELGLALLAKGGDLVATPPTGAIRN